MLHSLVGRWYGLRWAVSPNLVSICVLAINQHTQICLKLRKILFASSHLLIDSLPCCFPVGKWLKQITSGVSKTEGRILIVCTSAQFLWLKHTFVTAEEPPKREDCNYSCIIMPFPHQMEGYWLQAKTWETLIRMNCKSSLPMRFPTIPDLWGQITCLNFRRNWPRVDFLGMLCQEDANIICVSEDYLTCHWSIGVTGVLQKISFRLKENGIICYHDGCPACSSSEEKQPLL